MTSNTNRLDGMDMTDEHPAAKRMREQFEAKYGDMSNIMRAINGYLYTVEQFRRPYNYESTERVTHADLEKAEVDMLASIRTEAALLSASKPAAPLEQAGWCYPDGGRTRFADMGDTVDATFAGKMRAVYYAAAPSADTQDERGATLVHLDDWWVDLFAKEMKDKLAKAREKGRGGWQDCAPESLSNMLREHVEKGDPRDVANFCMFLWALRSPISAASTSTGVQDERESTAVAPTPTLADLHKELNKITWMGADEGWDRAIEAVRTRINEMLSEAK